MKIYYRFQYNTGELSMIVQDDRDLFDEVVRNLARTGKKKYPVAVFVVKERPSVVVAIYDYDIKTTIVE